MSSVVTRSRQPKFQRGRERNAQGPIPDRGSTGSVCWGRESYSLGVCGHWYVFHMPVNSLMFTHKYPSLIKPCGLSKGKMNKRRKEGRREGRKKRLSIGEMEKEKKGKEKQKDTELGRGQLGEVWESCGKQYIESHYIVYIYDILKK